MYKSCSFLKAAQIRARRIDSQMKACYKRPQKRENESVDTTWEKCCCFRRLCPHDFLVTVGTIDASAMLTMFAFQPRQQHRLPRMRLLLQTVLRFMNNPDNALSAIVQPPSTPSGMPGDQPSVRSSQRHHNN